jgi:hypothetical protein
MNHKRPIRTRPTEAEMLRYTPAEWEAELARRVAQPPEPPRRPLQ